MTNIVTVSHLSFEYPDEHVVFSDLSLNVQQGEWLAIIGQNGSGKSTLAKLMDGLLEPSGGQITVADLPVDEEHLGAVRNQIGMVFQNPDNQFVGATVEEDVAFGLENRQVPREQMGPIIEDSLKAVNMLDFRERIPANLSGGQKQRVAIAGIIAVRPQILILDEATSMLDPRGRKEIIALIQTLKQQEDLTVISITHDINEAAVADRIMLLNNGQLVLEDIPDKVLNDSELLKNDGLDVPFASQLTEQLRQAGVDLPDQYLNDEEVIKWLVKLNSKM